MTTKKRLLLQKELTDIAVKRLELKIRELEIQLETLTTN